MDFSEMGPEIMQMMATRANPAHYADEFMKALPEDKRKLVTGLQGLQVDIDKVLQEQCMAMKKVMDDFRSKLQPMYDRRREIVEGKAEPSDAEVAAAPKDPRVEGEDADQDGGKEMRAEAAAKRAAAVASGPGLPGFWLEALRNHDAFEPKLNPNDLEILRDLVHVDAVHMKSPHLGFIIRFVFSASKYIKSAEIQRNGPKTQPVTGGPCPPAEEISKKIVEAGPVSMDEIMAGLVVPEGGVVLAKCYYVESDPDGDQVACAIDGTKIEWADLDPTVRIREKKQTKGKGAKKQTRVVKTEEPTMSFFRMFAPVTPDSTPEESDEMEADESPFDMDFEVARALSGSVIPRAVEWFTRRATAPMADMDDDEEDDDEGMEGPGAMMGGMGGAGGQPGEKPECKQQ